MAEKRFSMGIFVPNELTHKLDLRIVRHFKWKNEKTAKETAQKIIGKVDRVKAIFIFDYATGKTLHCWIKKSQDFLSTVYCTQEELKKHLEENYQLSFTWKYGELINAEE